MAKAISTKAAATKEVSSKKVAATKNVNAKKVATTKKAAPKKAHRAVTIKEFKFHYNRQHFLQQMPEVSTQISYILKSLNDLSNLKQAK